MSPNPVAVPTLARRLLRLATGSQAEQVEPLLAELFVVHHRRDGARRARLWYWRQVAGFVFRRAALRSARADEVAAGLHGAALPPPGGSGLLDPRNWLRDLGLAVRTLAHRPAFAVLAILTLALGIGVNTAIFSVLYGSLLRPLPYSEPDRLVWISSGHPNFGGAGANLSVPDYLDLTATARSLDASVIYKVRSGNLTDARESERVEILYSSSGLFRTLGVPLQLGRDLAPEDDPADSPPVAILTDGLWRSRFGADPSVVGRTASVDARTVQIVGVAPPEFVFPEEPVLIMGLQHEGAEHVRGNRGHYAIARLEDGAQLEALRQEFQAISTALAQQYPEESGGYFGWADPLRDHVVGRNQRSLYLLAGAAALVLLIGCVNVTNLMLVRSETRQRELAVRYSLGATRAGLVSLFVGEGLVLASLGGVLGVVAAFQGVRFLVGLYGAELPRADEIGLNLPVLAFSLAVSLAVGLVVGLVPLLRSRTDDVHERLKDGSRGSAGRGSRLNRALVIVEVALAVLIVIGASLLANSMWRLQSLDLGVTDGDRVLTFRISAPAARYGGADEIDRFFRELREGIERLPGTVAIGLVNRLPLLGGDNMSLQRHDDPEIEADFVSFRMVTEGYFEAAGIPLFAGRYLDRRELVDGERAIVVNRTLARQLFGTDDTVGRRVVDPMMRPGSPLHLVDGLEIVGVVGDVAGGRPDEPPPPAFYFSWAVAIDLLRLAPGMLGSEQVPMSALLRTAGDPRAALPGVRGVVREIDPDVPVFEVATLDDIARQRLGARRFSASLFGVFAGLALLLGAIGIYGVMSFGVAQRSRELGVRMALGANRRSVLRLVLSEGARLSLPGLGVGLVLAALSSRALDSLLFGISALDPATYTIVAVLLGLVCLAAAYLPARRATLVDPLTSIRGE